MSKISIDGIGAVVATFAAADGVKGGQVVKVSGNGTAGPCSAGDKFCGVALEPRAGAAGVQVAGFVQVTYTGSLSVGPALLTADGQGGVKAAASQSVTPESGGQVVIPAPAGVSALVVSVETDGTAVLFL